MTQEEAQAEAQRRWGPRAIAKPYQNGKVEIVLDLQPVMPRWKKSWGPITQVLGYGNSWEDALKNASNDQYAYSEPQLIQLTLF